MRWNKVEGIYFLEFTKYADTLLEQMRMIPGPVGMDLYKAPYGQER